MSKISLLPFERDRMIFYHLYFEGIPAPMIIEAKNKDEALKYVSGEVQVRGIKVTLENIKLTTPIYGVTEKTEGNTIYIWCGLEIHPTGWMEQSIFKQRAKIHV